MAEQEPQQKQKTRSVHQRLRRSLVTAGLGIALWLGGSAWAHAKGNELRFNPMFWSFGITFANSKLGCLRYTQLGPILIAPRLEPRKASRCRMNLRDLDLAVEKWAMDHHLRDGATVETATLLKTPGYLRILGECPEQGCYPEVLTVGEYPAAAREIEGPVLRKTITRCSRHPNWCWSYRVSSFPEFETGGGRMAAPFSRG